jgi:hypothetical protein
VNPKFKTLVDFKLLLMTFMLAWATTAQAGYNTNLIVNGDAESVPYTGVAVTTFPGWTTDGTVSILSYGVGSFIALTDPSPTDRGNNFFYGGAAALATASQNIDISFAAVDIDSGIVTFNLSAWLGGYDGQDDNTVISVDFYDAVMNKVGTSAIGPVLSADRGGLTGLLQRASSAAVPANARSASITMTMTRLAGSDNDGYADDVSLVLALASKVSQNIGTISFNPTTLTVGGTTTASASATSSLAVTFASTTPAVCTVAGNIVTGLSAGTCTIAANQAGNANYSAATQVLQNINISPASPTLLLSTTSLTFANQLIGVTSAAQTVTLSNSGSAALLLSGIFASGDFAQTNNCGTSVAAGANCTFTLTFTPMMAGAKTGSVTITSLNAASHTTINLSGTGVVLLNLVPGWNLLGNSINAPLEVAANFGDANNVTSVWKWIGATGRWAFYSPSLATSGTLSSFALSKGLDVLTSINGGEGFWVNAKNAFSADLPVGSAITATTFADNISQPNNLQAGWSLIATGDNLTPRQFVTSISAGAAISGVVPASLHSVWTWDSGLFTWYFYAPSLDNSGGLASFISGSGYLDFGNRTLTPTSGFWVNHP